MAKTLLIVSQDTAEDPVEAAERLQGVVDVLREQFKSQKDVTVFVTIGEASDDILEKLKGTNGY